jgi:hypothetical protein
MRHLRHPVCDSDQHGFISIDPYSDKRFHRSTDLTFPAFHFIIIEINISSTRNQIFEIVPFPSEKIFYHVLSSSQTTLSLPIAIIDFRISIETGIV